MTQILREHAMEIFRAGLAAADPEQAVLKALHLSQSGVLSVGDRKISLAGYDRVFVVGAGKAACPMARALEKTLPHITEGQIVTKYGHVMPLDFVKIVEGGHPVPDANGMLGARAIIGLLEGLTERDLVFCVISGGGSALLPLPAKGLTLAQKQEATSALLACGAPIQEMNAIRKHLSAVKGGQLVRIAHPATMISLVLSDVIGDDLDIIASGPTTPDPDTFQRCLEIIDRHQMCLNFPAEVMGHLERGAAGDLPETPKPGDPMFNHAHTLIVGSSRQSLLQARDKAKGLGYNTMILSSLIDGEAQDVAKVHVGIAKEILATGNPLQRPACVLSGGETTVTIKGKGKGGRNMEFALAAAIAIQGVEGALLFSAGTDGTDGPTDAAGAYCDGGTCSRAEAMGLDPHDYLLRNDSYNFFKKTEELVITGPTMTNVMDLRLILIS
ncbi:Hydroxypyruvate reductase [Desulfatibacillum aliphaticivorans]|uniref:Hydroxypyruvate reductase n=1 Tax=Desulfatibacillum aliphaticivorans TaxID=218208 RepID=B8FI82_DESAL|nr:glycerate kinase [Desulfatibacillum aliphaticivorans]ACL02649.1 Hydroxypyruvate reductase [Desulfatibacillum aliphaticivorans]